jgi:hypothetical protein
MVVGTVEGMVGTGMVGTSAGTVVATAAEGTAPAQVAAPARAVLAAGLRHPGQQGIRLHPEAGVTTANLSSERLFRESI